MKSRNAIQKPSYFVYPILGTSSDTIKDFIEKKELSSSRKILSPDRIIRIISENLEISEKNIILSRKNIKPDNGIKKKNVLLARNLFFYFLHEIAGMTSEGITIWVIQKRKWFYLEVNPRIARLIKIPEYGEMNGSSTIRHAILRIKSDIDIYPDFRKLVNNLEKLIMEPLIK